jgi:glycerol kinase
VQEAVRAGRCRFGTIDSWIIYRLTGGRDGGVHVTDVTNASRTMLMNLATLQWDANTCEKLGIPAALLPQIRSSSEVYGRVATGALAGVAIAGCLGDQQAAMVGQRCFRAGDAKNTYGTGCFMLMNTGARPVASTHGLLTTVCYQLGPKAPAAYALEGSVAIAGAGVRWLRDQLQIIDSAAASEAVATNVVDAGGVVFVPAFSGLLAPHWRSDARGVICGLSLDTARPHLVRALLEAVCFQSQEVLQAMEADACQRLARLRVDGGMAANDFVLQFQADVLSAPVARPHECEATALGAAIAAGLCVGYWRSLEDVEAAVSPQMRVFEPRMGAEERARRLALWRKAVARAVGWTKPPEEDEAIARQSSGGDAKVASWWSLAAAFAAGAAAALAAARVVKSG